jgi:hypothetical protein
MLNKIIVKKVSTYMMVTSGWLAKRLAAETLWGLRSIQTLDLLDGECSLLPRLLFVQWCRQCVGHLVPPHPGL